MLHMRPAAVKLKYNIPDRLTAKGYFKIQCF